MKTLEELMEPVSEDSPSGEDMDESFEFDQLRTAFEMNFAIDAKVVELDEGEPEPAPVDWEELLGTIEELTGKTKDLFLAVSYARCGLVIGDVEVVDRGLQFTASLLEDQWDTVHPAIDGPLGFAGRAGICEDLARRGAFPMPLMELPIINEGRSSITGGQLCEADDMGPASTFYPEVSRVIEQLDDDRKAEIAAQIESLNTSVDRIATALTEKGDGDVPDFTTLRDTIVMIGTAFRKLAGFAVEGDEAAEDAEEGEQGIVGGGAGGASFGGAVRTRDDVVRALTAIEQYYAHAEPGHPVKVAVARLRGWVTKDFMQILEDIVPHSVDDAKNVLLERNDME